MVGAVEVLRLLFRVIVDDDFERPQNAHGPGRFFVEVFADAVFQERNIDQVVVFGHADLGAEIPDRLWRVAPPPHPRHGGHARIIPALHIPVSHQVDKPALAQHGVAQVEPGEFNLPRPVAGNQFLDDPVVERAVVFELQRADGMRDALQRVGEAMGEVVHRIDHPPVARPVVRFALDPV